MKLLTKQLKSKMPALYSTEEIPTEEKIIICKFFSIVGGWTWYVIEGGRQENDDYLFYGLVDGIEKEWGYFTLRELESVRFHGIPSVERDLYFDAVKVGECRELRPQAHSRHYVDPAQVAVESKSTGRQF